MAKGLAFLKNKYFWVVVGVVLISVAWAGLAFYEKTYRAYPGEEAVWIKIPRNSSEQAIQDSLKNSLGVDYGKAVFELWTTLNGRAERAPGAYRIKPGDRVIDIARRLRANDQTPVKVAFNNIRLIEQLAPAVCKYLDFSEQQFNAVLDSTLAKAGYDKADYIGAFLPDSYEFYWTAKPDDVVKRLVEYRDKFWNDDRRAKAAKLGLSPEQVTTLASIVDEETAASDEKATVARLYLNRLEKGMRLQADPTVKYAVGDFTLRRILNSHLQIDSPYNTYKVEGLPPGPIRMPEKATIDAVLNAPQHDYLFMCARETFDGHHNFAKTMAEHNENARRYRAALDARGIK